MSIYKCPKGHESTESDYCSECGVKINGSPVQALGKNSVTSTVPKADQTVVPCPDCGASHEPDSGDFCEICGYNFATGAHGEVPPISLAKEQVSRESNSPLTPHPSPLKLEVIVTIDPSLRSEDSPPPPTNQSPITFNLDKESNLIGRRSEMRGIHPDIPLNYDDAVSHRHALLIRQPDGSFVLRDIGSSNGTKLNGVELQPMVDAPIKDGDEFTLGHWTRIKVQVISQ